MKIVLRLFWFMFGAVVAVLNFRDAFQTNHISNVLYGIGFCFMAVIWSSRPLPLTTDVKRYFSADSTAVDRPAAWLPDSWHLAMTIIGCACIVSGLIAGIFNR